MGRREVFISYSRKDEEWLEKLLTHLKPLQRSGALNIWVDQHLNAGDDWRSEIEAALSRACVAVLLVTPHFLASDFISNEELPRLLRAAKEDGIKIIWIPITDCMWRHTPIKDFQAAVEPSKPLNLMGPETDRILVEVCEQINTAVLDYTKRILSTEYITNGRTTNIDEFAKVAAVQVASMGAIQDRHQKARARNQRPDERGKPVGGAGSGKRFSQGEAGPDNQKDSPADAL